MGSRGPAEGEPRRPRLRHESAVLLQALASGAPAIVVAGALLARSDLPARDVWALLLVLVTWWVGFAVGARDRVAQPLRTIANLIGAVREGDYSFRARRTAGDDALAEAMREVNSLASALRDQRTLAVEATALLDRVMQAIDVAIFAFDRDARLRLVNPAGARLLGREGGGIGETAEALGLAALLAGEAPRTVDVKLPGGGGPFELRRATFRSRGLPHELVVMGDLRRALREEEQLAWQRLVRVLGHEINNSLAPIHAIATHLHDLAGRSGRPDDWEDDLRSGLAIVSRRAEALGRFLAAYAKLARVPRPTLAPMAVAPWITRVAALETRVPVAVRAGPEASVLADADQVDQLLINLVRNAADAALETGGGVEVTWMKTPDGVVEVRVLDEGPGIANTENLFVPFFTTKASGSGIGLVLSRQIAEAHRGALALEARLDQRGAVARLRLPARAG